MTSTQLSDISDAGDIMFQASKTLTHYLLEDILSVTLVDQLRTDKMSISASAFNKPGRKM